MIAVPRLWVRNSLSTSYTSGTSVSSNSVSVLVAGSTTSLLTLGTNTYSPIGTLFDPSFIAKYDTSGNLIFAQALSNSGDDWLAVSADKFCNAYITGDYGPVPFVVGTNTLIPTSTVENTFTSKLTFTTSCNLITAIPKVLDFDSFLKFYPNPNSGSFNLQLDTEISNGELILINTIGQKVYEQTVIQGNNTINVPGLAKGLYNYVLLQNKQKVNSGKLVID